MLQENVHAFISAVVQARPSGLRDLSTAGEYHTVRQGRFASY